MTRSEKHQLTSRYNALIERIEEIEALFPETENPTPEADLIGKILAETRAEASTLEFELQKKREWIFSFIGGGWNTVRTSTVEEAQELAATLYGDKISKGSFRESTPEDMKAMLSLFY